MSTKFAFTEGQMIEIQALAADARSLGMTAKGAYTPLYQRLADMVADWETTHASDITAEDAALAHQSHLWLMGAADVNANRGAFSAFIRQYNFRQGQLRYGVTLYKAMVTLNAQVLQAADRHFAMTPGMQVTAEINQGQRTVMAYLLSPVQGVFQEAMRER